jgi:hypothetical protein
MPDPVKKRGLHMVTLDRPYRNFPERLDNGLEIVYFIRPEHSVGYALCISAYEQYEQQDKKKKSSNSIRV